MTTDQPGQADYVKRVNHAIDHIVQHLDQPLRLDDLARVACFSPFHFHRVFRSLVGETLKHGHRVSAPASTSGPGTFEVSLHELPPRTVAYVRVLDPFRGRRVIDAVDRLMAWADARGVAGGRWLGYMWDDPEVVAQKDCRYDVGVEVGRVEASGEIGRFEFPEMLVAQVELRGGIDLEMRVTEWLFGTWLPASGYVPTDQPTFEAWMGRPFAHGSRYFELCIQLPVKRW